MSDRVAAYMICIGKMSVGLGGKHVMNEDTAVVKSLHPNICIAVHCSISLHPQGLGIMSQLITRN